MSGSINSVVIVGNLTRDPELRATGGGVSVCGLRIAVNDRVKDPSTGEWGDRANYFDVDVFGAQGERCAQYLARGRQVAVEGRLRWREWQAQDGSKRQAVSIVGDSVQFLGPRDGAGRTGGEQDPREGQAGGGQDPVAAPSAYLDDEDIPF